MRLAIVYALLAFIAAGANIGAQELVVRAYAGAFQVLLSVALGTAVGLVVKYVLDKRFIFRFRARDAAHDGQTFALYALMGLGSTGIFWGFEFAFHYLYQTREMRYLGAGIGLAIGYVAKYHLDKVFVFRTRAACGRSPT